jgi:phospholipid transport system substrate-binding protein
LIREGKMKLFKWVFVLLLASVGLVAVAAEVGPDELLRKVTDEVLEIVRTDKDIKSGDSKRAMQLVEEKVLPNFNFPRMTQLAVGKDWRQVSPEQRKQLTEEFKKLLVRTYSKALTQYKNQTIAFKPFELAAGSADAKVRTEVRQAGAKPLALDYYLEKADATWKVYDIEVEGISLVTNYRETFASEIRANGVDGLISTLKQKNLTSPVAATK